MSGGRIHRPQEPGRPGARWRAPAVLLLGAALVLTGCSSDSSDSSDGKKDGSAGGGSQGPKQPDPAAVTITPADGATGVDVLAPVTVAVQNGKTTGVKVVNAGNQEVDGALDPDGKTWKPKQPFSLGGKYTVTAVAVNEANAPTTAVAKFATISPDKKITASFFPDENQTVGVGQPVSIRFDAPVKNKDAVIKALTVEASPVQEGAWHWFGSQRVDYRPKEYWKTGSTVKVGLNLRGTDLGGGAMSTQYKTFSFKVSPNKVNTLVDAAAHTMKVYKNDQLVKTIPVTTGEAPKYSTWGGKMVIQEKYAKTRMNSQTVGLGSEYDIDDVPWAVRITTSGTFVHGNYWASPGIFGKANTSHGCISMTPENAKWFYDNGAMPGDILEVVNTKERVVSSDNGYGDWNLTWAQWTAAS